MYDKHSDGSVLETALTNAVRSSGKEILLAPSELYDRLEAQKVGPIRISQVILMVQVPGLSDLIRKNDQTIQNDINIFLNNALSVTGFRRSLVLELTADILAALGIAHELKADGWEEEEVPLAYTVPASVYEEELAEFEKTYCDRINGRTVSDSQDYSRLAPLVKAGIPQAQLYMGEYLLHRQGASLKEKSIAYELLSKAYDGGECRAGVLMGDYCFEKESYSHLTNAFELYTGYGGIALNEEQCRRVDSIFEHKRRNLKTVISSAVLMLILQILRFLIPAEIAGTGVVIGTICTGLSVVYLILQALHYMKRPFDNLGFTPVVVFALWIIPVLLGLMLV